MVARAFLIAVLSVCMVLLLPGSSQAQTSTLTVVDNEPLPGDGPGDNMIVSVRRNGTYVVSLAFNRGEAVTHRLERDGQLTFVGRTPAGPEPRQVALAHGGDLAIVANSVANELGVFSIGDDGLLREINRVPSGGLNPYDVAVAHDDIVVVANRDSNRINTFYIDRQGRMRPLGSADTGLVPHVVSVSRRDGMVAVSNHGDRSVSVFEVNRRGELDPLETITLGDMRPQALAWQGRRVFVAADKAFPEEDVIRSFAIRPNGQFVELSSTPAGVFLTGLAARSDMLFAVTVNRNNPADPNDDRNEIRAFRIEGPDLIPEASVQTPGFPPSFKQIAARRGRGGIWHLLVTEFQAGWLRSLIYAPDEP